MRLKVTTTSAGAVLLRLALTSPPGDRATKEQAAELRTKIEKQAQAAWAKANIQITENGFTSVAANLDVPTVLKMTTKQAQWLARLISTANWPALPPKIDEHLLQLFKDVEGWGKHASALETVDGLPKEDKKRLLEELLAEEEPEPDDEDEEEVEIP